MKRRDFLKKAGIGAAAAYYPLLMGAETASRAVAMVPMRSGMTNFGVLAQTEITVWSKSLWDKVDGREMTLFNTLSGEGIDYELGKPA